MKKILLTIACSGLIIHSFAQNEVYELPVYFGQFFNDQQINPALQGINNSLNFTIAHKRNSNDFGGINTSVVSLAHRLKTKKEKNFNVLGGYFSSDKEGFLIRRNRAYGFYSRHLQINDKFYVSGSLSFGYYNFAIKANETTGGFSDGAFDGTGSVALYSDQTRIGFSINQFSNSSLQPIDQTVILARHYSLLGSHSFILNENIQLTPSLYGRYSPITDIPTTGLFASASITCLFQELLLAGISNETNNGLYFFLGIENLKVADGSGLDVTFSYFLPNGKNSRVNIQQFELIASYYFNQKEK